MLSSLYTLFLPAPFIRDVPTGTATQTPIDRAIAFDAVLGEGFGAAGIAAKSGIRIGVIVPIVHALGFKLCRPAVHALRGLLARTGTLAGN